MKSSWDLVGSIVLVMLGVVLSVSIYNRTHQDMKPMPEPAAPKLRLIYVSSAKCLFCDRMKRQTFAHPRVAERLSRDFVFVEASGKDAVGRYAVKAYPTYLIVAPDGKEVRRSSGYRNADEFLAWLDQPARGAPTAEFSPLEP